jgi:hypothetical protein
VVFRFRVTPIPHLVIEAPPQSFLQFSTQLVCSEGGVRPHIGRSSSCCLSLELLTKRKAATPLREE